MEELGSIGRAFATPQFIISVFVGLIMIAGGIYLLVGFKPVQASSYSPPALPGQATLVPPQSSAASDFNSTQNTMVTVGGALLIVIGCIIPFAAWWRRKLIKRNPQVAAFVGLLDVAGMFKFLF
jgi:hypothetical protein